MIRTHEIALRNSFSCLALKKIQGDRLYRVVYLLPAMMGIENSTDNLSIVGNIIQFQIMLLKGFDQTLVKLGVLV